jgi:hypothetical protein
LDGEQGLSLLRSSAVAIGATGRFYSSPKTLQNLSAFRRISWNAVLGPAPRVNLTRFHGILAPAAKWRAAVVRVPAATQSEPPCDCENGAGERTPRCNYAWALLMARVFEVDVLECPGNFEKND